MVIDSLLECKRFTIFAVKDFLEKLFLFLIGIIFFAIQHNVKADNWGCENIESAHWDWLERILYQIRESEKGCLKVLHLSDEWVKKACVACDHIHSTFISVILKEWVPEWCPEQVTEGNEPEVLVNLARVIDKIIRDDSIFFLGLFSERLSPRIR